MNVGTSLPTIITEGCRGGSLGRASDSRFHDISDPSSNPVRSLLLFGEEDQTTEHILQRCPNHDSLRRTTWPTETALQTKLYGCSEDLEKTAQFTLLTGLTV